MQKRDTLISEIIKTLKLNRNKAKEVRDQLDEISRREGKDIEDILKDPVICGILASQKDPIPIKARLFRSYLRRLRYPRLTLHEERFKASLKELKLPCDIKVSPPPCYEGNYLEIAIECRNKERLRELTGLILSLYKGKKLAPLLELV
jgi:hypothetical protein